MKTLVLTRTDLARLAAAVGIDTLMDEVIESLEGALRAFDPATTRIPLRDGFAYDTPHTGLLEWMPILALGRSVLIKTVGYHPDNPARGIPTVLATICLYDVASGSLTAVADGVLATALRTGAASAVASRLLARSESRVLGLVGCGMQAVAQLHALGRCFKLEGVLIHDVDPQVERSFVRRTAGFGVPVRPAPRREVEASADLLCTATSVAPGEGPVIDGDALRPWVHINAIGSDFRGKTELPAELVRRSWVCADFREQALREGECQHLAPGEVGSSLDELVKEPLSFARRRDETTIFDSTGFALEDHVALEVLLAHAKRLGLGTELPLESLAYDPWDPYAVVAEVEMAEAAVGSLGSTKTPFSSLSRRSA